MNKKLYIIVIALFITAASCRKEEVTVFPDYDRNWLVVNDDPADPAVHASYLFYKETGIPAYFNDTIGSQQRKDVFGKEFTYYEVLSLNYSLGGVPSGATPYIESFQYCSKADVPAALGFLKSEVIPLLPDAVHVPSILLVKTLNTNAFGSYAFKGFNTVVVGEVARIPSMNDAEKAKYKGAILRAMLTNAVLSDKYNDLLDKFYNVSRKFVPDRDAYGLYKGWLETYVKGLPANVTPTPQAIGFLGLDPRNPYYTPISTWMDVCMYIEAAVGTSESEFTQTYGSYTSIMTKYGYIKQILRDLGVSGQ